MITFTRIIIVGVTPGTGRLVLRIRPRDGAADGVAVAGLTGPITSMVARVITIRVMPETGRRPLIGAMAHIALLGGIQMSTDLTRCR